jgi:hypothetical protein
MRVGLPFLLLLLLSGFCHASTPRIFHIGEYRAIALVGETETLPDVHYISFTGDFGFAGRLPSKHHIERHVTQESTLLANFQVRVINLEFMLPGRSKRELDRQIDQVTLDLLKQNGFDVVSRANNHAMDFGPEGVEYNTSLLDEAGFKMIGPRNFPVYQWNTGEQRIAVFALTDYTDRPDPDGVILKINDADLELIKKESSGADFRIAFVHLGSMSLYPSPHERKQVGRILEDYADMVICTGSHFTKGFVNEEGKPVVYDIGNHLLSFVDAVTEPIGIHLVAGFTAGKLVQLFAIPFYNQIMEGKTGPVEERDFNLFQKTLVDRSTSDPSRYFADPSSLVRLKERIQGFGIGQLKEMRPRHALYAVGIVYHHYPIIFIASCLLFLILGILIARRLIVHSRAEIQD